MKKQENTEMVFLGFNSIFTDQQVTESANNDGDLQIPWLVT